MIAIIFIITGLITGILSGLFGIGGGVITTPVMLYLFSAYDFGVDHIMHTCIATSLATTCFTSLSSFFSHRKHFEYSPKVIRIFVPYLILGCMTGSGVSYFLSSNILQIIFGVMTLILSLRFLLPKYFCYQISDSVNASLGIWTFLVGIFSTILGVGGGVFLVPIFLGYGLTMPQGVAYSTLGTLVSAISGTICYLFISIGFTPQVDSVGLIYIPAMLCLGVCSVLTTKMGAKLAHKLPHYITEKAFAVLLIVTAFSMLKAV